MHPLDGPRRKLDRALEHVQALDSGFRSWYESDPARIISEQFDAETSSYVYRIKYPDTVPISFGVMVGDILHNLRSALDHTAWQLALLTTPTPYELTAFPICLTNGKKSVAHITRLLQCVPNDARKVIEELQPYNTRHPRDPELNGLWILDRLSNFDKHRVITLDAAIARLRNRAGMETKVIDNRTIELSLPVPGKNFPPLFPEMLYDPVVGRHVLKGGLRVTALHQLHNFISEGVIPRFDRFFPQSVESVNQKQSSPPSTDKV